MLESGGNWNILVVLPIFHDGGLGHQEAKRTSVELFKPVCVLFIYLLSKTYQNASTDVQGARQDRHEGKGDRGPDHGRQ